MSITFLLAVISHTPLWVWALLAGLVALGWRQTRDHQLNRVRLLALPIALGALSLWGVAHAFGLSATSAGGWLLGAATGVLANRWLGLPRRVQALPGGQFAIGGSWVPLGLMMLIFWQRYALAVALKLQPALAADATVVGLACLAYGLASGLFGARAARVLTVGQAPAVRSGAEVTARATQG